MFTYWAQGTTKTVWWPVLRAYYLELQVCRKIDYLLAEKDVTQGSRGFEGGQPPRKTNLW
jgi:hypothetical protein